MYCYKYFKDKEINLQYEPCTIVLLEGFVSNIQVYSPTRSKKLKLKTAKIRPITYTPDFMFKTKNTCVFIETKGCPNDAYPLKKKLFLKTLNNLAHKNNKTYWFFEPHNQKQVQEMYEIIKNNINQINNETDEHI